MLSKILTPAQDELLKDERRVLSRLRTALSRFDAAPEHQQALDRSIEQLDELFLLVVVGEFNAGKSAFINALLGSKVVAEGVTPTTAQINVLQYGETVERQVRESEPARHHRAGPAAPRHPHRRHARHQRHHPRARGDHRRSSCRGPIWCCSSPPPIGRSPRPSAPSSSRSAAGARRSSSSSTRSTSSRARARSTRSATFVADNARGAARLQPRDLSGQRAAGAPRQAGGAAGRGAASGFEALERYIATTLDAPGPRAAQAAEPARRRRVARRAPRRVRASERLALLKDDFDDARRRRAAARASISRT